MDQKDNILLACLGISVASHSAAMTTVKELDDIIKNTRGLL
jgi:hypothetical protein